MILFRFLSDSLCKLRQQPRGVFDLVSYGFATLCRCFRAIQRPPRYGDDLIQSAFERRCFWLPLLLLLRFQKQLRLGQNPLARLLGSGVAPSVVEQRGLPRGPVLFGEDLRHSQAMFHVEARHGSQIPHGDLRGNVAMADLLLHCFRQCVHQRQAARHPGRAAVETARQFFERVAVLFFHLGEQPALFERCFRLAAAAQGMHQQQGFGLAHRVQHERLDGVPPQLFERGDALVSIDHQILLRAWNDDDWRLLAGFSQRR
jgi:hypothetical protein